MKRIHVMKAFNVLAIAIGRQAGRRINNGVVQFIHIHSIPRRCCCCFWACLWFLLVVFVCEAGHELTIHHSPFAPTHGRLFSSVRLGIFTRSRGFYSQNCSFLCLSPFISFHFFSYFYSLISLVLSCVVCFSPNSARAAATVAAACASSFSLRNNNDGRKKEWKNLTYTVACLFLSIGNTTFFFFFKPFFPRWSFLHGPSFWLCALHFPTGRFFFFFFFPTSGPNNKIGLSTFLSLNDRAKGEEKCR